MILVLIVYIAIALLLSGLAYTNEYDEQEWMVVAVFSAIVWPIALIIFLLYIIIDTILEYLCR